MRDVAKLYALRCQNLYIVQLPTRLFTVRIWKFLLAVYLFGHS